MAHWLARGMCYGQRQGRRHRSLARPKRAEDFWLVATIEPSLTSRRWSEITWEGFSLGRDMDRPKEKSRVALQGEALWEPEVAREG